MFTKNNGEKMIVSDLNVMENIVAYRHDLMWDGWDVIRLVRRTYGAQYSENGMRVGNSWYMTERYPVCRKGWILPDATS